MKLNVKETVFFALLGALMYASKVIMSFLPNIHLIGTLIVAITVVYRKKALYPIYTFVLVSGFTAFMSGGILWWLPYLYVWTVLWGAVMLIPKKLPQKIKPIVYMVVCSLHGFLFGTLYAPAQALLFGLDFKGTVAWIIAGFPFDAIHGVSNFACGILICPIIAILKKVDKNAN